MPSRYYYSLRPPGYAQQPDGFTTYEGGCPKMDYELPDPFFWGGKVNAFGWVEYPEPLDVYKAWKFDLIPADPGERAYMLIWQEHDRDPEKAAQWITWAIDHKEFLDDADQWFLKAMSHYQYPAFMEIVKGMANLPLPDPFKLLGH